MLLFNVDDNKDGKVDQCDDGSVCIYGDTCNVIIGVCVGKVYVCNDIMNVNWKYGCIGNDCDFIIFCGFGVIVKVGDKDIEYV